MLHPAYPCELVVFRNRVALPYLLLRLGTFLSLSFSLRFQKSLLSPKDYFALGTGDYGDGALGHVGTDFLCVLLQIVQ